MLEPVRLSLRRLEERRVLDVSAAFLTGTGELELSITDTADIATITNDRGSVSITDADGDEVEINVDGDPGNVRLSSVQSIVVRGDPASDQQVVFDVPLAPRNGVEINGEIESAVINEPITRVTSSGIDLNALTTQLGANLEASSLDISFSGNVTLSNSVTLTASSIIFDGTLDDDGDSATPSSLVLKSDSLTRFSADVGQTSPIDSLRTEEAGRTEINGDISASGNTIIFNNPVLLTGDSTITDSGTVGIKFNDTVDSAVDSHHNLMASAPNGQVTFSGNIGDGSAGDQSLGMLTIQQAGQGVIFGEKAGVSQIRTDEAINIGSVVGGIGGVGVVFNGGATGLLTATTTGDAFRVNGETFLETDLLIETAGGNVEFTADSPINSAANRTRKLTVNAGAGASFFNEDIGNKTPLSGFEIRADAGVTFGGADTETAGGMGPVQLINTTGPIDIGVGTSEIGGSGILFNGGTGDTTRVVTTGDLVRLNGPVVAASHLSISTGSLMGDIVLTSAASLDSAAGDNNNVTLDPGAGAVLLNEDLGRINALGTLMIPRAGKGVVFGQAETETGPGGMGPVEVVRADRGIDLGVGSSAIGGVGIVANGGGAAISFETDGGNIRANGKFTLASNASFTTNGGDVTLTNDTPVDSRSGQTNNLSFDLGDGTLLVNEDIGRDVAVGALTVTSARGGVVLGEATTEAPGSGGKGPVEVINTNGPIDLGVGGNVIGGRGIIVSGSPVAGTTITTSDDSFRANGPTQLATRLTINTGSGAGNATFTNDAPIDSFPGATSDLILNLGLGAAFFNEDIGASSALGHFAVIQAAGVMFGGASMEAAGTGGSGPVNILRTKRSIDIGVGTNVIGGMGITFNGGAGLLSVEVMNDDVRLNGAILLQSPFMVDTGDGTGDITLTSSATLDSSDGPENATSNERNDVVFDAGRGAISINANVGSIQKVGAFTIERADAGVTIGGADTSSIGGLGPVTQLCTDGSISIGSVSRIAGGIELNGGGNLLTIATTGNGIDLNGPTVANSDVAFDTGPGGGDFNLSSGSTLDSQPGEANNVALTLGTGSAMFAAEIGMTDALGELRFVSANDVTAKSKVNVARVVQQAGSGTTRFEGTVNTTDTLLAGLDLTGTNFVFDGLVTATGNGSVSVTHTGLLDINDDANMQLDGSFVETGGTVQLTADISTSGDLIQFGSAVAITDGTAANVVLDTTVDGNTAGADIIFQNILDGETANSERISFDAGTGGNLLFGAAVGGSVRIEALEIKNANDVTATGPVIIGNLAQVDGQGTTTFSAAIDANSAMEKAVDVNTVNVMLQGAVATTGDGRVELTVSGLLDISDGADMNLSGSFLQDGGGSVQTSANITTSDDDVTFSDEVVARDDLRFDTGSGLGTVRFASSLNGTVDCQEDLHFATGQGDIAFAGPVGDQVGLGDVTVQDANDVVFASTIRVNSYQQAAGTGETRFDDLVTIKSSSGLDLTTNSVSIGNLLDTTSGNGPVNINVADDLTLIGSIESGNGSVRLLAGDDVRLGSSATIRTTGAEVTIQADADMVDDARSGGAVLMADSALVDAAGGAISISADENIQLGRLVTTTIVSLHSASGGIVDGGDAGGADIVADRAALHASTGIGTADPIDTQLNTIATRNEAAGGMRVENSNGPTLTIGDVDGLSGISAGPLNAPADLGGDIEVIHVGAINVNAPILNSAGGHTIVRAELSGDLTVNQPIQNRGGNGWIFLFSGEDLFIHHSLPEPQAEISVENEGAVRGIAQREVLIDNSPTDYVIIRTHAERSIRETNLTQVDADRFGDPTHFPPVESPESTDRLDFYRGLDEELRTIRNEVAPQATNFPQHPGVADPRHETDSVFASNTDFFFTIDAVDQGGSDADGRGRAIIEIRIGTSFHLERNWHVVIDWGDGTIENYTIPGNPEASLGFFTSDQTPVNLSPDGTITPRFDSGEVGPDGQQHIGVYYVHHTYLEPPNLDDPATPTPIHAELRYDARAEGEEIFDLGLPSDGSGIFNGIRFFRNGTQELAAGADDVVTNPGEGVTFFVKVVESVIIPVEAREVVTIYIGATQTTTTVVTGAQFEFVVASFEGETFEDYRLFMRVVDDVANVERLDTFGSLEEHELPIEMLDDPIQLFRQQRRTRFPDGHYRIYLEELRTGRVRMILEIHIYQGRVVPEDFREGTAERQPGADDGVQILPDAGAGTMVEEEPERAVDGAQVGGPATDQEPGSIAAPAADDGAAAVVEKPTLLAAAAASVPWRARVRSALRSGERSISKASLRSRRS